MTDVIVEPCEGGCGVTYWRGAAWEVVGPDDGRPTARVLADEPHTPQRCRQLRQSSEDTPHA